MLAAVLLVIAQPSPTYLFKWVDAQGTLHVTDRLADTPTALREKFQKQREEAEKRKKKEPAPKPPAPPAQQDGQPQVEQHTAYTRYLARLELERDTRERADARRSRIGEARAHIVELEEERGNLAANPMLNAAQPIRVERMNEIGQAIAQQEKAIGDELDALRTMIVECKQNGGNEDWVTGL